MVFAQSYRKREWSAELVLPPKFVRDNRCACDLEYCRGNRGCDKTRNEAQLSNRCGDPKLNAVRGSPTREGRSHRSDALVQYTGIIREVVHRPPGRSGDITATMDVGGEEGTERRKLAGYISASLRVRRGVYSAAAMRAGGASGAGVDGPPTKRSSSAPKTSAMVVQMSSWLRMEYQRNFQSTSGSKPG